MKPLASLSLDLDNQWSYMKTHGDPRWQDLPSYLDRFIPRLLDFLAERSLTITVFVVGLDCVQERDQELLSSLAAAGHEIGNHSYRHEPWLHLYSEEQLESELDRAESAIESATGVRPTGFRGPGFSLSETTLRVLVRRGYRYDASTLPTYLGPLARAYYLRTARIEVEQRKRRARLFGGFREGFRPLRPYRWRVGESTLVEVPVTTMPILRTPIHLSYLLYLSLVSPALAQFYFRAALRLCRLARIQPSILLHPLDFLGCDDTDALAFFPAMRRHSDWKLEMTSRLLAGLTQQFEVVPIHRHVDLLERGGALTRRRARDA